MNRSGDSTQYFAIDFLAAGNKAFEVNSLTQNRANKQKKKWKQSVMSSNVNHRIPNGYSDLGPCPPSGSDSDNNEAFREW